MNIPNPIDSPIAIFQYIFISLILFLGIKQYLLLRNGYEVNKSYVVPLGSLCLITGFIGLFLQVQQTFQAIEAAGDISPEIVAGGIYSVYDFPILGLIGLALSYAFKFINSSMITSDSKTDRNL